MVTKQEHTLLNIADQREQHLLIQLKLTSKHP